jgi:hypothetical protein
VIAKSLPVDYGALKGWMLRTAELHEDGRGDEVVASRAAESDAGPGFVEVDMQQFLGARCVDRAIIEVARADGARLVVQLPMTTGLDLAGLVAAFDRGAL